VNVNYDYSLVLNTFIMQ